MVHKNDLDSHYLFSPVLVLISLFDSVTTLFYQMPSSAIRLLGVSTDMQSAKWLGKVEHVLTILLLNLQVINIIQNN